MEDLDWLLQYSEDLKKEIEEIRFDRDDLRTVYFTYYYDLVYNLYVSKSFYKLGSYISGGGIIFSEKTEGFDKHAQRLIEISKHEVLTRSFNNNINRNFFFYAFSSFEFCVNLFCGTIIKEDELSHLLAHQLNEIKDILKNVKLEEKTEKKLSKLLLKTHLSHAPFIRKVDLLLKHFAKEYPGDVKSDREFLLFLSKLRNTVHSQWVYFGSNYEYWFSDDVHFVFENGKQVVWTNPYEDGGARLFIIMLDQLKGIWNKLIDGIDFRDVIPLYDENM